MDKNRELVVGICIFVAILFSIVFDFKISLFFQGIRNYYVTSFLFVIGHLSNIIILFFFLTSLFLWQEHKRRWILPLWLCIFFSVIISFILKYFIARPRPFLAYPISIITLIFKNNYLTWNSSFPSFHSMLVFSALPILSKEFKKLRYFWVVFASIIAFSRVYFGVHFFSDVLGGAIIGYLIGIFMIQIEEKYCFGKKLVKILSK